MHSSGVTHAFSASNRRLDCKNNVRNFGSFPDIYRDFGLSIELGEGQSYGNWGGNVKYSAPELLAYSFLHQNLLTWLRIRYPHLTTAPTEKKEYPYSEKTDIYSFGLIWWQILTKRDPFLPRPRDFKGGKVFELHCPDV